MRTIFFTSFYAFIGRNVFASNVLRTVVEGGHVRAVIFVPFYKEAFFREQYGGPNVVVEGIDTATITSSWKHRLLTRLALLLLKSYTLDYRKKERVFHHPTMAEYALYAWSRAVTAAFGSSPSAHRLARTLEIDWCRTDAFGDYFERYRPDAVFATDLFSEMDTAMLREAKRRGVATIGMVRSWDNNTTRGLCRVLTDWFIVNNDIIRDELVDLQGAPRDRIFVGGIPQFDRYVTGRRSPREAFCQRIGADPARRQILLAPAGYQLSDSDLQLCRLLAAGVRDGRLPADLQFLVRMHPACPAVLDGLEHDPLFLVEAPGVRFSERLKDTELAPADADHLADSIHHCEMVIHVSSSIGLDALVFDKPQIMIEFDGDGQKPYLDSVRRYHDEDHMKRFIATGAARIAKSADELFAAIAAYLANPGLDADGRARGRAQQCEPLDGQAGRRIGDFILEKARAASTPEPAQITMLRERREQQPDAIGETPRAKNSPKRRQGHRRGCRL